MVQEKCEYVQLLRYVGFRRIFFWVLYFLEFDVLLVGGFGVVCGLIIFWGIDLVIGGICLILVRGRG